MQWPDDHRSSQRCMQDLGSILPYDGLAVARISYLLNFFAFYVLQAKYVQTYAVLVVILLAVRLLEGFAMTVASRHASQRLHDINFNRVMTGTMAYFDTTPLGRILNRFSGELLNGLISCLRIVCELVCTGGMLG